MASKHSVAFAQVLIRAALAQRILVMAIVWYCAGFPASSRTLSLQLPVGILQPGSHLTSMLFLGD